jgi:hypothetical protein
MGSASASIKSPREVLSFWFSEEAYGSKPELLESEEFVRMKSKSQWYAGTKVGGGGRVAWRYRITQTD